MIVYSNKNYESNTNFPNSNPYPDNPEVKYIVDETTKEGRDLSVKVMKLYPYYDFIEENGNLIDVKDIKIKTQVFGTNITTYVSPNEKVVCKYDSNSWEIVADLNGVACFEFTLIESGEYKFNLSTLKNGETEVIINV